MVDECREFIDSLYPNNREWKDNDDAGVSIAEMLAKSEN